MSFPRFNVMTERPKGWVKIGEAFTQRDGVINVKLDALPISGLAMLIPECSWCAKLGLGTSTATTAHANGHPEQKADPG